MNIRDRLTQLEQQSQAMDQLSVEDMSDDELIAFLQRSTTMNLKSLSDVDLDAVLLTISKGGSHVTA